MCQATIYIDGIKVMEDVIWFEPAKEGILARTFFEAPQLIKGALKGVDLLKHRVLLTSSEQVNHE